MASRPCRSKSFSGRYTSDGDASVCDETSLSGKKRRNNEKPPAKNKNLATKPPTATKPPPAKKGRTSNDNSSLQPSSSKVKKSRKSSFALVDRSNGFTASRQRPTNAKKASYLLTGENPPTNWNGSYDIWNNPSVQWTECALPSMKAVFEQDMLLYRPTQCTASSKVEAYSLARPLRILFSSLFRLQCNSW
jgi:hypothetical protein